MKRSIVKHAYVLFIVMLTGFLVWGCGGGGDGSGHWDSDDKAPFVTDESPADGSIGVLLGTTITPMEVTATFNEAMEPTTLTTTTFTLKRGIIAVSGEVNYAGVTAVFTPDVPLLQDTLYTATITTGAEDLAGNPLASNYVWEFTTLVVPDTIQPFVISTSAADGATGLPINRNSTATFNEPMDSTTLVSPATSFTLCSTATNGGACVTPVAGVVSYIGNTATFNPDDDLTNLTWYRAEVTAAATDPSGNALVVGLRANPWWWQTAAILDVTGPQVTFTNPADTDIDVPLDKAINATFDEEMLATTLVSPATNFVVCSTGAVFGGLCIGPDIAGEVVYNPITNIATFTPAAPLTAETSYTAEILTAATDLAGNPLTNGPVPNPWSFTTVADPVLPVPLAIDLGAAESFGIAARAGMTSSGVTVVNGDIALYSNPSCTDSTGGPGLASADCTGFKVWVHPTGMTVNGSIYYAGGPDDLIALQVTNDLTAAWNEGWLKPDTFATSFLSGQLAGKTLLPGVYHETVLNLAAGGTCQLDAVNDANAIFIIKVDTSLTDSGILINPSKIELIRGAQARNVWFIVNTAATIGTGTVWNGNILAGGTLSISGGSTVNGRLLGGAAGAGAFTMTVGDSPSPVVINVP